MLRRRLVVFRDLLLLTVPTYLVNVLLLTFFFQAYLPPGQTWAWAAATWAAGLGWLAVSRTTRGTSPTVMAGFALVVALLYSWFLITAFPRVPVLGQIVLTGFSGALVSLGAVSLSTLPLASAAWLVGQFVGILAALMAGGRSATPVLWVMLLSLAVVLALVVANYYRMFQIRIRAEAEVAEQSQLVSLLLHDFEEGAQDWLWETDSRGRMKGVSARLARQLGRQVTEIEDRSLLEILIDDASYLTVEDEEDLENLAGLLKAQKPFRDQEVPVQTAGQHRRWRLAAKPIFDEAGVLAGWRGVGSDVTEVQRLNNLNARLALLDNLTGLANRHRLMEVLHDHSSPRNGARICVLILLDLQGFRMVNEGLGHEVGDSLLKEVALRLRSRVPSSTLLARLGGDEFAVVAPGASEAAVEGLIAALDSTDEEPFHVEGHRLELRYHLGVAAFPRDAGSAAELLKCAEMALHEAKSSGQGLAVVYQSSFGEAARDRIRLQGELRTALMEDQFELHYQPQFRRGDGSPSGAEALMRWKHPVRGPVSPGVFIPVLEETGLIIEAGVWVLENACREALTWSPDLKVAVNVSAVQFASRTFLDSVRRVLRVTAFPPGRLELEITESVMAQDPKQVVQILNELRALGISIALDDFGTGYSSLSYLRTLPLDKLKVDQSFVRVLDQDPNAGAIVRAVLDLSRTLGLETTAEGVETEAQRDRLGTMGVDHFQGYLYSKPLTADQWQEFRVRFGKGSDR